MKGLLKNLGLILILVGAVILVACSFTGNVNNNAILGTSAVLIVIGLISYILINKPRFSSSSHNKIRSFSSISINFLIEVMQ